MLHKFRGTELQQLHLWYMLALAMKVLDRENSKKKRERQEGKEEKVASRKAAAGCMRLGRLCLMQQLAVMRVVRPFCHTFPAAQHTSSQQPSTPEQQPHLGLQCVLRLPGRGGLSEWHKEVSHRVSKQFSSGMSLSSAQTEVKLTS